jgi:GNAT superfamily N-acetyltransferase
MLTTRVGGPGDAAGIARLWTAAGVARRAESGLPVHDGGIAEAERQVRGRLSGAVAFAVLGEDGGELVAMAIVLQALDKEAAVPDPVPGLAHVSMVAVRPDRWGQGLAARVLDAALPEARERGFARAQLWTHETNHRARRLYERLGWVPSGRTRLDDNGEPIRHYVRDL